MGLLSNIIDLFKDKPLRMDLIYNAIENPSDDNLDSLTPEELKYANDHVFSLRLSLEKHKACNGIINKV
jgi:hypothetical protein